jgi:hypothetical protein
MYKAVAVLAFAAFICGCHSIGSSNPLGDMYPILRCVSLYDKDDITSDQVDTIRYLAKQENCCTMILGKLYERGHGVPQDYQQAKAIYQAAASVNPAAYSRLGTMAAEGIGGPVDLVAARDFYLRATAHPGNTEIELKVAAYLENGIGGAQDLPGALEHYFNAGKAGGSESWKGVERLRAKGVAMTIEQQQRYNNLFVAMVRSDLETYIETAEKTLEKVTTATQPGKPVQVQLAYIPGTLVPVISLYASCGDNAIDQKVMQGFKDYRFPGDPIVPAGQKNYQAIASVRTDGMTPMERFYQDRKTTR